MSNLLPLTYTGVVVHGRGLGRTVGMPTANIAPPECLPDLGVYASRVLVNNHWHMGVTNIGYRPSVDERREITFETHILDFSGDLYGMVITVRLCAFLRPTLQLHSLHAVKVQVSQDIQMARQLLA
ncbi:MAG: riboflavin kinase [Sphaerochaetaceae bacterium]|nr:riboflavin kinase [Spirochaetales bacterium]MDY5500083.1 riboflavin kinase [Sphaerochaetaceae bacterium]